MKKWTTVDRTLSADGRVISLHEHDGSYAIRVNGATLMSTRQHGSEEKIAEWACAHLKGLSGSRVLIGGLGFGFTLRAALSALAADATVVVAEILSAVISWNRNPSFPFAADDLADPRVTVVHRDVREAIGASKGDFDSIILDVDNGPDALTADSNSRLYNRAGLQRIGAALRPRGCVAIWSAAPDPDFERLMASVGFRVEALNSRSRANSGCHHTIFLGRVK